MLSAYLLCSWSRMRAFAMYSPFTRRARELCHRRPACAGAAARAVDLPRGTARVLTSKLFATSVRVIYGWRTLMR